MPTFSDADDLERLVRHFLADPEERHRVAHRGMELVRDHHTFDTRAARFTELTPAPRRPEAGVVTLKRGNSNGNPAAQNQGAVSRRKTQ